MIQGQGRGLVFVKWRDDLRSGLLKTQNGTIKMLAVAL
jgi:hypothetical protein